MKKLHTFWFIAAVWLTTGCSQIVYNHMQVMEKYRTQQDVENVFGEPNEIKNVSDGVEWLYDESFLPDHSNGVPVINRGTNTHSTVVTEFTAYKKYVRFSLDTQGNVLSYDSSGVDFTKRQTNVAGTIMLVGAMLLLIVPIAIIKASGGAGIY